MKESSVSDWHKHFEESSENVEDDIRSGRLRSHRTDENVEKVRNMLYSDSYLVSTTFTAMKC
jgi:hypothetical protein